MPNAFLSTDNLGPQGPAGPAGADGADGAPASGDVDYTLFDPRAAKDDLSGIYAPAQTGFKGSIETYLAEEQIINGSFVQRYYRPQNAGEPGPSVRVKRIDASNLPDPHEIVGVALDAAAAVGDPVRVLTKGFATANRQTEFADPPEIKLDASTNGRSYSGSQFTFRDSGGAPGDYGNSQSYMVIFDAGAGTWDIKVNSFDFEHSTSSMYDRLGVRESSDGSTWTNLVVPWMQRSATSSPPYSTSFAGSSWNSSSSDDGWIFPQNTTRAILLGMPSDPYPTISLNSRYIQFWFTSDGSATRPGWDLTLTASNSSGSALSVALDTALYIDAANASRVTENSASGLLVAHTGWSDAADDSILVRL